MATETDAARDRVIAARADLGAELEILEASARAAVDIPAKIKRSPAKAAAVAGGVGFLALKGPQRLFGAAQARGPRAVQAAARSRCSPTRSRRRCARSASDGDKVRGALERDFARVRQAGQRATGRSLRNVLLLDGRPAAPARAARSWPATGSSAPTSEGFADRLAAGPRPGRAPARRARRRAPRRRRPTTRAEEPPTGV